VQNFIVILGIVSEVKHEDGQTDRQTDHTIMRYSMHLVQSQHLLGLRKIGDDLHCVE
jgi:hypothetical protein